MDNLDLKELRRLADVCGQRGSPVVPVERDELRALLDRVELAEKEGRAFRALIGAAHAHLFRRQKTELEQAAHDALLELTGSTSPYGTNQVIAAVMERIDVAYRSSGHCVGCKSEQGKEHAAGCPVAKYV